MAVTLAALPAAAPACDDPVFQYALANWRPDRFEATILTRGPLSPADEALLARLSESARGPAAANLAVRVVDLASSQPPHEGIPGGDPAALPWLVVRHPSSSGIERPAWSGPLTASALDALLDSPARREIARRLLDGDSVVWLLVGGGDPQADDAAARRLQAALAECEAKLEPPVRVVEWPDEPIPAPPPPLRFALVRIARRDAAEAAFVSMLLSTEGDLKGDYAGAPKAFAFYGRGRCLNALVGDGINPRMVRRHCEDLIAACAYEDKLQNAGMDMLFAADWSSANPEMPLTPQAAYATPARPEGHVAAARSPLVRNTAMAFAGLLALVLIVAAVLQIRRRAARPR